jgi:ABC-type bacteriocin/lantibiotic exporter with double-glycine peptidase domain
MGLSVTPGTVVAAFPEQRQRVSFADIGHAAAQLGLRASGRQMTTVELWRVRPIGILHVDEDHFVALTGYEGHRVRIMDGASPKRMPRESWDDETLARRWDGRILIVDRG